MAAQRIVQEIIKLVAELQKQSSDPDLFQPLLSSARWCITEVNKEKQRSKLLAVWEQAYYLHYLARIGSPEFVNTNGLPGALDKLTQKLVDEKIIRGEQVESFLDMYQILSDLHLIRLKLLIDQEANRSMLVLIQSMLTRATRELEKSKERLRA